MEYHAVLDIGSRMITMALRFFNAKEGSESTVYAAVESHGIANMTIENNPQVVTQIKQLCAILKTKTGIDVKEVYVSYIGGIVSVKEFSSNVPCTGIAANHTLAKQDDLQKLEASYLNFPADSDSVVVDHFVLEYKKDDQPYPRKDLVGSYAKTLSCRFLMFLAQRTQYERLQIALEDANLKCRGMYVGLRACGTYLINSNERAQALVLLDDAHSEVGFYENGVLTRYEWFPGGWDVIRKNLLKEDPYLRPTDLEVSYLKTMDLTAFKPEWFAQGNTEDDKLKKVGGHLNVGYLVNFRELFTKKWDVNQQLKHGGGVILTGSIAAVKGIEYFFNLCLARKLQPEQLYTIKVAKHEQPPHWEASQSQNANESFNLFSVPFGLLNLLKKDEIPMSVSGETVTQEKAQAETPSTESESEREATKEKERWILGGVLNRVGEFFGNMFAEDLSSYDADKEDAKKEK